VAYKPARGRIPLREQMLANRAVMLAMCPDQEARDRLMRELPEIAEKKVRAAPKPSGIPLESEVQKAVLMLLRSHPKVAFAIRVNSGTFAETDASGNQRYISANSLGRRDMLVPDIVGMMKGSGRFFSLEVKRANWTKPHGEREMKQGNFLYMVEQSGGISAFVRSVDDVIRILETA